MKKLFTLLTVFGLVSAASAATIAFGNTGTAKLVGLDGTTQLTSAQTFAFEIWYLGEDNALNGTEDNADSIAWKSGDASVDYSGIGKTKGSLGDLTVNGVLSPDWAIGDSFYLRLFATFGETTYYMDIFAGNVAGAGYALSDVTPQGSNVFTWQQGVDYGGTGKVGDVGKWIATTPIPEPATAGLAIAGLALLFKRRRK